MLFQWSLGIRCVKFILKKIVCAFFGCIRTARTWGTPKPGQKSISLTAYYTTILKGEVYFLLHIWKIQSEPILVHYWLFSNKENVLEWWLHELDEHFVKIHQKLKAKKWCFKMKFVDMPNLDLECIFFYPFMFSL